MSRRNYTNNSHNGISGKAVGKSDILLGITLNPRKCIGVKVKRIPKKVIIK